MSSTTLRRTSATDELTALLQREILHGTYAPGTRMREVEFAARYDVSRNTLREALHRLNRLGLVEHRPHRGVLVARPGVDEVREIFRMRRVLEPAGLRATRTSEALELGDIARDMAATAAQRDWPRLVDQDTAFHAWLVHRLGSSRLDHLIETALRELRLAFIYIDRAASGFGAPSHIPDHEAIAGLLAEDRKAAAVERLVRHLDASEKMVLGHLRKGSLLDEVGEA